MIDEYDDPAGNETELVEVALFDNRLEAELAGTALTAAGIRYVIGGEVLGAYGPVTGFAGGFPLRVRPEDAEMARTILSTPPIEDSASRGGD